MCCSLHRWMPLGVTLCLAAVFLLSLAAAARGHQASCQASRCDAGSLRVMASAGRSLHSTRSLRASVRGVGVPPNGFGKIDEEACGGSDSE